MNYLSSFENISAKIKSITNGREKYLIINASRYVRGIFSNGFTASFTASANLSADLPISKLKQFKLLYPIFFKVNSSILQGVRPHTKAPILYAFPSINGLFYWLTWL